MTCVNHIGRGGSTRRLHQMFIVVERFIRDNPHLDGGEKSFSNWNYRYYAVLGPNEELLMTTRDSSVARDAASRLNKAEQAKQNGADIGSTSVMAHVRR